MNTKKLLPLFIGTFALTFTQLAHAGVCVGTIKDIMVTRNGEVRVTGSNFQTSGGTNVAICDLDGTNSLACESWLKVLLSAHLSGKEVVINYSGSTQVCNALPANFMSSTYYVRIRD